MTPVIVVALRVTLLMKTSSFLQTDYEQRFGPGIIEQGVIAQWTHEEEHLLSCSCFVSRGLALDSASLIQDERDQLAVFPSLLNPATGCEDKAAAEWSRLHKEWQVWK